MARPCSWWFHVTSAFVYPPALITKGFNSCAAARQATTCSEGEKQKTPPVFFPVVCVLLPSHGMESLFGLLEASRWISEVLGREELKGSELGELRFSVSSVSQSINLFSESLPPEDKEFVFKSNQVFPELAKVLSSAKEVLEKFSPLRLQMEKRLRKRVAWNPCWRPAWSKVPEHCKMVWRPSAVGWATSPVTGWACQRINWDPSVRPTWTSRSSYHNCSWPSQLCPYGAPLAAKDPQKPCWSQSRFNAQGPWQMERCQVMLFLWRSQRWNGQS